jgi:RNA polymerase sigma-70 factor (ECF subfamily)
MSRVAAVATVQIELVERARSGDHDAFSVLVRASVPRLLGAATLILRDQDRAQDAVQEALMLAWRHIRALRDPEAWDAWLYRLTVRACYRLAKTVKRRSVVELHVVPDREPATEQDFATTLADRDLIGRELGRLPVDQRTVMVLHFHLDQPLTDVADILNIPVGTAKSRLHRGLETLRTAMAEERNELHLVRERPA